MKLFILSTVLMTVLMASKETLAYSEGAPDSACANMDPFGHYPVGKIDSVPPFSIVVNATVYRGQDILSVTIQGKPKRFMKGFLLQARSAKNPDLYPPAGSFFDLIPPLKLTCANGGVTHKQLLASNSVTVRWSLGNSTWQDIVFKATVMESRYLWYANVNSAIIVASSSANTTTTPTPTTTPVSASPGNTSATIPAVPRPPVPTFVPTTTTTTTPAPTDTQATATTQTAPTATPTPVTPSTSTATTPMTSTATTEAKLITISSATTPLPPTSTTQTSTTIAATTTAQVTMTSSSTTLAPTTASTTKAPPAAAAATAVLPSTSSPAPSSSTPSSPMTITATSTTPLAATLSAEAEIHAKTDSPLTTAAVAISIMLPANNATSGTADDKGSTPLTSAATTEHGHPASGEVTTTAAAAKAKPEDVRVGSLGTSGAGRAFAGHAVAIGSLLTALSFILVLFNNDPLNIFFSP